MNESELKSKIMTLASKAWHLDAMTWPEIELWLDNFSGEVTDHKTERLYALYLLSNFMHFAADELKELLRILYREKILYQVISRFRKANADSRDLTTIRAHVNQTVARMRFIGLGSAASSGTYLLYQFRTINELPEALFKEFSLLSSTQPHVLQDWSETTDIVFIDDICGSGRTLLKLFTHQISHFLAQNPHIRIHYYCLFATKAGFENIANTLGSNIDLGCVFSLDESYTTTDELSRYLVSAPPEIDPEVARRFIIHYGRKLARRLPLGWEHCGLMLSFHHNTPNNSLPIFWHQGTPRHPWKALFPRHVKGESAV